MSEEIYDKEIAPLLMQVAEICKQHNFPMVAEVEYLPGERGSTSLLPPEASLAMTMILHCADTAPNVDSYIIGLARYCKERGIDYSSSVIMREI